MRGLSRVRLGFVVGLVIAGACSARWVGPPRFERVTGTAASVAAAQAAVGVDAR